MPEIRSTKCEIRNKFEMQIFKNNSACLSLKLLGTGPFLR